MHQSPRHPVLSYAVAVAAVLIAAVAGLVVDSFLQAAPFVSLFICAILFAAWIGGPAPGLLATALSLLAFVYFFIPPRYSLLIAFNDMPRIVLFAVAALFVVWISAAQKRAADSLRRARDDLRTSNRELAKVNEALKSENAERMRAESSIRRAEQELEETLDTIPTLAWRTRADGFAEYINRRWLDYTGLSLDQALGWEWQTAIHPDDQPMLLAHWRDILAAGKPAEVEARMRRFDGQYRWFLFRPAPLYDESGKVVRWYGTNTDIEDRKQAERALRRSEAYLAEAQRLSHTGSFGWKVSSDEVFWSKETYRILEYDDSVKPTAGLMLERVHPQDQEFVRQEMVRASKGARDVDYEHRLLLPDATVKYVHVRAHRQVHEAGEEELVGALMDVTAARHAQHALQTAQTELAHATRMTTLGQMSASIAHEVNQPLTAIIANAQSSRRWLSRPLPVMEEVLAALTRIVADADRASEIVRRIRTFAKKTGPEMAELHINDVVEEAILLVRHEAFRYGVVIRFELSPGLPPIGGDRVQLQQVIVNLVVNAMQAMTSITDSDRVLTVRTQRHEADKILVAVEDVGTGIQPDNFARLFSAFYTTKPDGLGMGLSICRSIIEAHGGRIWASPNTGRGTTFQFTLLLYGHPTSSNGSAEAVAKIETDRLSAARISQPIA